MDVCRVANAQDGDARKGHGPAAPTRFGDDLARLLKHPAADARAIGARLAGALDCDFLRADLTRLLDDPEPEVRGAAAGALDSITPDGGRGREIVRVHGGFAKLKAYTGAEIVYDASVVFCDRFIDKRSRTHDQMVQAARSGKQNIVEGSAAAGTSSQTELRLVGVARASLDELLEDYQDFLRQRGLPLWTKEDPRAQGIRRLAYAEDRSYALYRSYVEGGSPEVAANTIVCLIHQTCYLLDRLLKQLERDFVEHGGIAERMHSARRRRRDEQARGNTGS